MVTEQFTEPGQIKELQDHDHVLSRVGQDIAAEEHQYEGHSDTETTENV